MESTMIRLARRNFLLAVAGSAWTQALGAAAATPTRVLVHRDASCGCCGKWAERLRAAGYAVEIRSEPDMKALKSRLGVPAELASCHTAEIDGYVVEGHTPVAAIERLLSERPEAKGVAVPGMPAGSPGMEMGGDAQSYEVVLFGPAGRRSYGRFQGDAAL
jgi:hypothetical protein